MNTTMFIIIIAIVASLVPIIFQYYTRDREMSPTTRRLMWGLFVVGVVVFIAALIVYLTG